MTNVRICRYRAICCNIFMFSLVCGLVLFVACHEDSQTNGVINDSETLNKPISPNQGNKGKPLDEWMGLQISAANENGLNTISVEIRYDLDRFWAAIEQDHSINLREFHNRERLHEVTYFWVSMYALDIGANVAGTEGVGNQFIGKYYEGVFASENGAPVTTKLRIPVEYGPGHFRVDVRARLGTWNYSWLSPWRSSQEAICSIEHFLDESGEVVRGVESLIAALQDANSDVRRDVVAVTLGRTGDTKALESLMTALKDKDPVVQVAAVAALGDMRDKRATRFLITAIQNASHSIREAVLWALVDMGEFAVEELITVLQVEESEITRRHAAFALSKIGDARAIEPLIGALKDKATEIRTISAMALQRLGDVRAVEPLISALKDQNEKVRAAAAIALGASDDARAIQPLIEALGDKSESVRLMAAGGLIQINDNRAIKPLINLLREEPDGSLDVKKSAMAALAKIGKDATDSLIAALDDEDFFVRIMAINALMTIKDGRAVEPLVEALKDDSSIVRVAAALALGEMNDERCVEPLIEALEDESIEVRVTAAIALSRTKDPRAIGLLDGLRKDEELKVRAGAAAGLGNVRNPRAVTILGEMLSDGNPVIRSAVVMALGARKESGVIDLLIKSLKDQNEKVRAAAAIALGASNDARSIEPLIGALQDQSEQVRGAAAIALGATKDSRATTALTSAMKDWNLPVVAAACRFFISRGELGTEGIIIEALKEHGDETTARMFYNSGNARLRQAARRWAKTHDSTILFSNLLPRITQSGVMYDRETFWGQFMTFK